MAAALCLSGAAHAFPAPPSLPTAFPDIQISSGGLNLSYTPGVGFTAVQNAGASLNYSPDGVPGNVITYGPGSFSYNLFVKTDGMGNPVPTGVDPNVFGTLSISAGAGALQLAGDVYAFGGDGDVLYSGGPSAGVFTALAKVTSESTPGPESFGQVAEVILSSLNLATSPVAGLNAFTGMTAFSGTSQTADTRTAAVPEPGSLALLLAGGLAAGLARGARVVRRQAVV
jgi:hypothetical protein